MIIGFCGAIGAGKTSAANYLIARHGFRRGKFAAALKNMLRMLLVYRGVPRDDIERMIEGDLKEAPSPHLMGRSPRHAMQTLGTEWGRACIGEDFWIETELAAHPGGLRLVFDDLRFVNEAAALRRRGGYIVRIERRRAAHVSEVHVSEVHVSEAGGIAPDAIIANAGDLPALHAQLDRLLEVWAREAAA